jgi:2-polyprenyl-6-methoxyphenol hydroxylase-like FAD-dependent oxidoreductase
MVATAEAFRNQGHATRLLEAAIPHLDEFDIAALSPATEQIYRRLGWEFWRGPLSVRQEGRLLPTPEECVMLLALPRTPRDLDWERPLSVEWRAGEVW